MMELLKKLSLCIAPSGHEKPIRDLILEEIGEYIDDYVIDPLGNLIAHKKGPGKKIMVSAHMDEIGLMATFVEENGFIRFCSIGGIRPANLVNTKVIFQNGIIGVVGAEEKADPAKLKVEDMFIDIGASDREDALSLIEIGDVAGYYTKFALMGGRVTSKSMDDRVACYIAIETLKNIKDCPNDLYFVFSTQEEVGLRGAKGAAFSVDPDMGIALDVTKTGDTPEANKMAVKLGNGAAIKIKDGSILCHRDVVDILKNIAIRENIKWQPEVLLSGGTDAGAIHVSRAGVPSGGISIPCRYIHSPSETVSMDDVVACTKLLTAVVTERFSS